MNEVTLVSIYNTYWECILSSWGAFRFKVVERIPKRPPRPVREKTNITRNQWELEVQAKKVSCAGKRANNRFRFCMHLIGWVWHKFPWWITERSYWLWLLCKFPWPIKERSEGKPIYSRIIFKITWKLLYAHTECSYLLKILRQASEQKWAKMPHHT